MSYLKTKKPSRPDINEILSRMRFRFINGDKSDSDDLENEENKNTMAVMENTIKNEVPVEKSPDDEIAELMLKLNGQVDEELVASIRSRKKMYENQSEVDSMSSTTNNFDEIEQDKPRIILTLRPNENKPDSYVSSSNLSNYNYNSPKRRKTINEDNNDILSVKRLPRRSNDSNQSVLKSAIVQKEKTLSIDTNSGKESPKKIKKESEEVINEVNEIPIHQDTIVDQQTVEDEVEKDNKNIKDIIIKEENIEDKVKTEEINIDNNKKKKKKLFRGGRYNIFKKKLSYKERQKVKKSVCNQLDSDSVNLDVDSSETNSEKCSTSVCSDVGTIVSSDKNDQDEMDTTSITDMEGFFDEIYDFTFHIQEDEINLCTCDEYVKVIVADKGKVTCNAKECVDGRLIVCKNLAFNLDNYGNIPMLRANVNLPFSTFCLHHLERFNLHQCCPRCGQFCSEGIFMTCKNNHFSHIGCCRKEKGCLHCGESDVYDFELKRQVVKYKDKKQPKEKDKLDITIEVGNIKLSTSDCPPGIDVNEFSKNLQQLKDEIDSSKHTMYSVLELYEACELNDVQKIVSIIGSECNHSYTFPNNHNRTALHAACTQGNIIIVYLLLQAGIDPNLVDDKMKSPMRMAAKHGHSNVIKCLIDFNGAPEIKDAEGMTSLHIAAKNGKLECCKTILNKRPSMVNWKDNGGWTPLVWACENGHIDVVEFFTTHKPNTKIPDQENNVALHWAAISGCLEVVKCIVNCDSEVNMYNDAGDTALHISARKNDFEIVSFLLDKGALAMQKNKMRKRPIDYCPPNSECYNLLKNVSSVTSIEPFIDVNLKCIISETEIPQTPIFIKTTPDLVSEDITHGCEDVPIRCVNEIDDDVPVEFTYIKENCYDIGNYVDSAMSHIACCNCEGACNTNDCKCVQANGECLYDENGRLASDFDYFNPSVILYECNWRCKCHKQRCANRVIQKGIKIKLELFKHKDMGWAVRTLENISRGTFVCEYIGEIITDQKANDLKEDSYLFNLENPGTTELYCIDAFNYSNVSRFINHSCDPNLMSVRSFINHHDKRFPRIAFFAVQDIKEYDQLSYDYGTTFWKIKGGLFTCKCGKTNCNFSDKIPTSLHIDSDNEEPNHDKNIEKIKTLNDNTSNLDKIEINKIDNSLISKSLLSKNTNISKQNNEEIIISSSKDPIVNIDNFQKNNSKILKTSLSTPKNGLTEKYKSSYLSIFNKRKSIKNITKRLLKITNKSSIKIIESKVIQNKHQQVIHKKKFYKKKLNGNLSLVVNKKVSINKKKSSKSKKDKMCNGDKVILESVQPNTNKATTAYILRPKMLNSNKKNIKAEDTILSDVVENVENKKVINVSSDTLSNNQITARNSNYCNQLTDLTTIEIVDEQFNTEMHSSKQKIVNGEYNCAKFSEMACTTER